MTNPPSLVSTAVTAIGAAAIVALVTPPSAAGIIEVEITGSVLENELSRGPFMDAVPGDPVKIAFLIDPDADIGGGDIHIYNTVNWSITVGIEKTMLASSKPAFFFSTFVSFHGFQESSTGFLQPGGGSEHNYRLPDFAAAGPPVFWLPQGSTPELHPGFFPACLFDTQNENLIYDADGGGPGIDQVLRIDFDDGILLGIESPCPGDFDGNGTLDGSDLDVVLSSWGTCECSCAQDLDFDGAVGFGDVLFMLVNWGPC